ncbi:hypothetical protein C8R42DRAFT_674004 [Lentinula raphanica]|nr:hypothetical protein C8R42DRAFT_674004 [Lentinula raphanica]
MCFCFVLVSQTFLSQFVDLFVHVSLTFICPACCSVLLVVSSCSSFRPARHFILLVVVLLVISSCSLFRPAHCLVLLIVLSCSSFCLARRFVLLVVLSCLSFRSSCCFIPRCAHLSSHFCLCLSLVWERNIRKSTLGLGNPEIPPKT